ncbi:NRDE family protein [Stutzerimonas stutzeri]|uniref:NRDE family protein n=1 Tax=Stutzerimonas stutzeri TaxID=316 RepID=UPI001C2EB9A8|nr:NRDE family protein [Stutzerimonas stutzeri]
MCLIVFAWRPSHALPLIVAANRDEFHARPSLPLAAWDEAPTLVAGRDLQAGGTWLGVDTAGRFAALTNIRAPGARLGTRSRGELPERYLRGALSPEAYLTELTGHLEHYSGFNLLVGDARELWYLNSQRGTPQQLGEGIYGLSNAALDTPWPKLLRARQALRDCLEEPIEAPQAETLLQLLSDPQLADDHELPSTGVPYEWEKRLSSVFITGTDYGTRASTVLIRHVNGAAQITERRFGPAGLLGQSRIELSPLAQVDES